MDAGTVDVNLGGCRVEVLIFQLAQLTAIHGVGHVGSKARHVKQIGAAANLLVRGETDFDGAVGNLRVG